MAHLKERVAYFVRKEFITSSERRSIMDAQGIIPGLEEALLESLTADENAETLYALPAGTVQSDEAALPHNDEPAKQIDEPAQGTEKTRRRPANAGGRNPIPDVFPRHESSYQPPVDHPALVAALQAVQVGTHTIEQYDLTQLDIVVNRMTCPVMKLTFPGGITTRQTITPPSIIERGQVSDHFLVVSAVDKVADHLPCYRQEQRLHRLGAEIPRSKLCRWMITMATYLLGIKEAMLDEIMQHPVLGIDDTVHRLVVPERPICKKGRIWAISAPSGIFYSFHETRSGDWIAQALRSYSGGIMGDAFVGHNALLERPNIIALFCWAHARRKFFESADKRRGGIMLDLIAKLYAIESDLADKPPDQVFRHRCQFASPILAKIHETLSAWQADPTVLPKSGIGKAVNYVLKRWDGFQAYLRLGDAPIDNNRTEQGMRPNAMHRKNSLFSASLQGAEAYATLSTLIHSARMLDLNPIDYLTDVIDCLHHNRRPPSELTPAAYASRLNLGVELRS